MHELQTFVLTLHMSCIRSITKNVVVDKMEISHSVCHADQGFAKNYHYWMDFICQTVAAV